MSDPTRTFSDEYKQEPYEESVGTDDHPEGIRDQAGQVAETALESGQRVADVAKEQASNVAEDAKSEATDLLREAREELRDQAAHQQERLASGLQTVSDDLSRMASTSDSSGVASAMVSQASERAGRIASWLGNRDPGSLVSELTNYARRNPGTFIAVAAAAGVLAGRLTRSVASGKPDDARDTSPSRENGDGPIGAMRPPTARIIPADSPIDSAPDPARTGWIPPASDSPTGLSDPFRPATGTDLGDEYR